MNTRVYKIGEIGQVITGGTPPTKIPKYYGDMYPFITPSDIIENRKYVSTERFLSLKGFENQKRKFLPEGAVCVVCIASIGKMCMTTQPSFTNQQINSVIVDNSRFDNDYIFYLLKTKIDYIKQIASGAASPIVNKTSFSNIEVEIPELPAQRKVGKFLSYLDDLIENNTLRIQILEEIAQLIYREWFVHYRFSGHEHVKMVDSRTEFGKLPEGWELIKVNDLLLKIQTKKKIQKGDYLEEGLIPIIDQGRGYIGGYTNDKEAIITDNLPMIVFGDHTRIIKFINFPFARGADGTQLICSSNERMPNSLFYLSLLNIDLSNYGYARHFKFLKEEYLIVPSQNISDIFDSLISPMYDLIKNLHNRNMLLIDAREILLPKLISGEIDVSELDIEMA